MNWLEILKNELLEITKPAAYELFPVNGSATEPYCNPRYAHVTQVEKEALKLMNVYGGDRDIVLASVWIHDRYKPLFKGENHANRAADWTLENLESKGFPQEKVEAVEYAVRNHAGWTKQPLETLEAKILWDSDKIAHTGPGILLMDILMYTSKEMCEDFFKIKAKYEPTVTLDNILPSLQNFKKNITPDDPNPYHFEESFKTYFEKMEVLNTLIDALQRHL